MRQRFFTSTAQTRLIKNILNNTPIPIYDTVQPGDYIIKGCKYIYNISLIRCIKSGILEGDGEFLTLDYSFYWGANKLNHTETLKDATGFYDSKVHEWLGRYLRAYRDMMGVNLMPFYNCFSGVYTSRFKLVPISYVNTYINENQDTTTVKANKIAVYESEQSYDTYSQGTDEFNSKYVEQSSYKVLQIPVKLNRTYTIAIDCDSTVRIAPAFINHGHLVKVKIGTSEIPLTDIIIDNVNEEGIISPISIEKTNTVFIEPFTISINNKNQSVINTTITEDNIGITYEQLLQRYEKYLYLLIQLPKDNTSSVVVLEGDYTNLDTDKIFSLETVEIHSDNIPNETEVYEASVEYSLDNNKNISNAPYISYLNVEGLRFDDDYLKSLILSIEPDNYYGYQEYNFGIKQLTPEDGKLEIFDQFSVDIAPAQNLHGYNSPWPAGGGKNLFDGAQVTTTNTGNWGVSFVNDTLTIEHKTSYSTGQPKFSLEGFPTGTYVVSFESQTRSSSVSLLIDGAYTKVLNNNNTFTIEAGATYAIGFTADQGTLNNIVKLQLELGSSATSYAPYSNICPISGWTGANITRTGKNVFDFSSFVSTATIMRCTVDQNSNGSISVTKTEDGVPWFGCSRNSAGQKIDATTWTLPAKKGQTIVCQNTFASFQTIYFEVAEDNTVLAVKYISGNNPYTVTSDDCVKLAFRFTFSSSLTTQTSFVQLEYNLAATTWEPYQGESYSVSWVNKAGTVYGGTLNVITGELTVTHVLWTNNTSAMNNSENYPGWINSGIRALVGDNLNKAIPTDYMNIGTIYSVNTQGTLDTLFLSPSHYHKTQTEWKALALDVQIAVEVATPTTIQLTPTEVTTLLGENNIWADCGKVSAEFKNSIEEYTEYSDIENQSILTFKLKDYKMPFNLQIFSYIPIPENTEFTIKYVNPILDDDGSYIYPTESVLTNNKLLDELLLSKLSLLQFNDEKNYPFADTLIEYLTLNAIDSAETISDNIKRTQDYFGGLNRIDSTYGAWSNYLRAKIYLDTIYNKQITHLDNIGYVDKIVESTMVEQKTENDLPISTSYEYDNYVALKQQELRKNSRKMSTINQPIITSKNNVVNNSLLVNPSSLTPVQRLIGDNIPYKKPRDEEGMVPPGVNDD